MKILKKITLCAFALTLLSSNAWGAACTGTVAACDSISDAGGGPGITLKLSPNVQIGYNGTANAYAMASWNSAGTKGYGVISNQQGIYVTKNDITAVPTVPAASGSFASATWAVVGQ